MGGGNGVSDGVLSGSDVSEARRSRNRAAGRAIFGAIITVSVGLVLAWARRHYPLVVWVVGAMALLAVVRLVARIVTARSFRALAIALAPVALGLGAGAVVAAVGAESTGRRTVEVAGGNSNGLLATSPGSDAVVSPTVGPPTVAATVPATSEAPTTTATSTSTSTASATAATPGASVTVPAVAPIADAVGDCAGCVRGADLAGVAVFGDEVTIQLAAAPADGVVVRVWSTDLTLPFVEIARVSGAWIPSAAAVRVTTTAAVGENVFDVIFDHPPTGIAVTTDGDRVPDVGVLANSNGATVVIAGKGTVASRVEADIAAAEMQIGALIDPVMRNFAISLVFRQIRTATYTYSLTSSDPTVVGNVLVLSAIEPSLREDLDTALADALSAPTVNFSLVVRANELDQCQPDAGGVFVCSTTPDIFIPITGVRTMETNPASVTVSAAPTRTLLDRNASCVLITASVDQGPATGESCGFDDFTIVYSRNDRTGSELALQHVDPVADPTRFEGTT